MLSKAEPAVVVVDSILTGSLVSSPVQFGAKPKALADLRREWRLLATKEKIETTKKTKVVVVFFDCWPMGERRAAVQRLHVEAKDKGAKLLWVNSIVSSSLVQDCEAKPPAKNKWGVVLCGHEKEWTVTGVGEGDFSSSAPIVPIALKSQNIYSFSRALRSYCTAAEFSQAPISWS